MSDTEAQKFYLGDWLVEPDLGRVSRGEEHASLRPREMDLLIYLAGRPGEVLKTDDIIRDVWSGVHVTNDSLYFSMSQLRKVLDDKSEDASVIETIPKRGYRLTAPVTAETSAPSEETANAAPTREPDTAAVEPIVAADTVARSASPVPRRGKALAIAAGIVLVAGLAWVALPLTQDETTTPVPVAETRDASSIAVMPFIDLTPETDYTYFSDGITEEILNRLTRIPGLRVAARTSSFTFKESGDDVIEIGKSLGVANLLEGSVRKEGDRVRVAVQLIDATTGFQRWSGSYDRQLTSVFEIQNEISRRVAAALEITLAGGGDKTDRPATPDVLDEYLLGLEAYRTQTFESLAAAVEHFETVLERDPSFTGASVQLAAAQLELLNTGASSDMGKANRAETLLQDVIAEHPDNAAAHRVMGIAKKWSSQTDEARRELNLALQLAPSDSEAMTELAHLMGTHGEVVESRKLLARALRIDPFSNKVLRSYAVVERQFGRLDEAENALRRAVELHPGNPNSVWMLGTLQASDQGNVARGLDNYRLAADIDTADYEIAAYVAATYVTLDMEAEAQPWIRRAEQNGPDAATTQALLAIREVLNGQHENASEIALRALEQSSYRIYTHSLIVGELLPIIVGNAIKGDGLNDVIERLEAAHPSQKFAFDELSRRENLDSMLAFSYLSRTWLVSLATLYKAAGMEAKLANAMNGLALTRIDALADFRDRLRSDDYLLEAEVLALEDDIDGSFAMLNLAVDNELLYLWQFNYAKNPAFKDLRSDRRWEALMSRVRSRVAEERELATTTLGMVHGGAAAD